MLAINGSLEASLKTELQSVNKIDCRHGNDCSWPIEETSQIVELPQNLLICLKRLKWENDETSKIDDLCQVKEYIDLQELTSGLPMQSKIYRLKTVICHRGGVDRRPLHCLLTER